MPERIVAEMRSAPGAERRRSDRGPRNCLGIFGVGWGHPFGEGLVRDLSAGGARLSVARTFGVPDEFVLQVPSDGDAWRRCRVVRRAWCEVVVRFAA